MDFFPDCTCVVKKLHGIVLHLLLYTMWELKGNTMESFSISELELHDATIEKIWINSNSNFADEIYIEIVLYDQKKIRLHFKNCFMAELKLSMWIIGNDSIRDFSCEPTAYQASIVKEFAKKGFLSEKSALKYINFNLNKTNSNIEIVYQQCSITSSNDNVELDKP